MILTGNEIIRQQERGAIEIDPFRLEQVNPNSYNYRLGHTLLVPRICGEALIEFDQVQIPRNGYVILPGRMYLGHTAEKLGSSEYAMSLIGRSSMGRLGLFVQLSANLGHTGSSHQWTLELTTAGHAVTVYAGMEIGQISFWCNYGHPVQHIGHYNNFNIPTVSKLPTEERWMAKRSPAS